MSSEDKEAQEDELLALASIYDEDVFKRSESAQGGETRIFLELPQDFIISVNGNSAETLRSTRSEYTVSFLPPLVLNFELPPDYPSTSPPVFTLRGKWLSRAQLSALCRHLDDMWEENRGSVVLFAWMQFLKEETLSYLKISSPYELKMCHGGSGQSGPPLEPADAEQCEGAACAAAAGAEILDARAVQDVESLSSLIREILDSDQAQRRKCFDSKMFLCNICFCEKLGNECMYFMECSHVYCRACLKDYFEIQIRDGQVQCLNCPDSECSSVATPGQVKELVGEQLFARYDRLLLQSSLDRMADVVYCPRRGCQTPVMKEPESIIGICSYCNYAFCTFCRMTYHGISPCQLTAEKLFAVRREYLEGDRETKRFLEQRYGKRVIEKILEEMDSKEWLESNSKTCPGCAAPIEKIDGCNKMTCASCMLDFCWMCRARLSNKDPYAHFNDPASPCFNGLFNAMLIDGEPWEPGD